MLLPGIARTRYAALIEKQAEMLSASEASIYNKVEKGQGTLGIIACGIGYNYVKETLAIMPTCLRLANTPCPKTPFARWQRSARPYWW